MPRPGPRRPHTALRLDEETRDDLNSRAVARGLVKGNGEGNTSEMIRVMIAYAQQHMPPNWSPGDE